MCKLSILAGFTLGALFGIILSSMYIMVLDWITH